MFTVTLLLRHTIASLTALSVLMCSVLCACPSLAKAAPDATVKAAIYHPHNDDSGGHDHQDPKKSCHGHGAPALPGHEEAPAQPCGDHGGTSCSHCMAGLVTRDESELDDELRK